MEWLLQPAGSMTCGQTSVAMAVGISLEESILVFGHTHGTYTRDLVKVLRHFDLAPAERLRVMHRRREAPRRSILHMGIPNRTKKRADLHWMLFWDGQIYDPAGRFPRYPKHSRITSFLDLAPGSPQEWLEVPKFSWELVLPAAQQLVSCPAMEYPGSLIGGHHHAGADAGSVADASQAVSGADFTG